MKTKHIPVTLALIAGFVACILSFMNRVDSRQFVKVLFLSVLIFFILGCVLKIILDRNFPPEPGELEQENQSEDGEVQENEADQEEVESQGPEMENFDEDSDE